MKTTTKIAWAMAALGLCCAVAAAWMQGGTVAALAAASVGFNSMAAVLGYTGKV